MMAPAADARYVSLAEPIYEISRNREPRLTVAPPERVVIETEDAFTGQIRKPGDVRDKATVPFSNPVTGPIAVVGAEPGDTLVVWIEDVQPLIPQCATYVAPLPLTQPHLGGGAEASTRICLIGEEGIVWSNAVTIPYAPLLGCVATAPLVGVPTTGPAGDYGGNLDLTEITIGAKVHLPVFVPGALLYVGDCHAAQGDGEIGGAGLEMPARVTAVIGIEKHQCIPGPRIETPTELVAIAVGPTLESATGLAYSRLALWLEELGLCSRWEALGLLTQVGMLSHGYVLNQVVAAKISRSYVEQLRGRNVEH
jgi:amidase